CARNSYYYDIGYYYYGLDSW
nr:immunoglobulin heavy chain junction region [Macaca mulatta]MOX62555.1 immunoglobulin heavy chain junction region [Macaca mulatta]MOX63444.1 immunoglobulin heavy chain junction region [Macaca mulatta]